MDEGPGDVVGLFLLRQDETLLPTLRRSKLGLGDDAADANDCRLLATAPQKSNIPNVDLRGVLRHAPPDQIPRSQRPVDVIMLGFA